MYIYRESRRYLPFPIKSYAFLMPLGLLAKAMKSCSPINSFAAAAIASRSSGSVQAT